uniref:Phospholipase, putative n=1 Tax=Theileria annulata TaxID=5874 RepID=A0A3B0NBA0_THEAN
MARFNNSLGIKVFSGQTKISEIPIEVLRNLNLKNHRKAANYRENEPDQSLDSLYNDFSLRPPINYLLKNQGLKFDRILGEYISSFKHNFKEDTNLSVYKLFGTDFNLVYLNPNLIPEYQNSNDPSYYQLFLSLLSSVNSVLMDPNKSNLDDLKISCVNLDSCLFSREADKYISDILKYYQRIGAVELSRDYQLNYENVKGVSLLDSSKLVRIGSSRSDIGFSFSPCGFLMPYHLGILSYLCDYNVINCTVPLSGASSGSLSICYSVLKNTFIYCMNVIDSATTRLRQNSVDGENLIKGQNLDTIVKDYLYDTLAEGSNEFINSRIGKITVAYSVLKHLKFRTRSCSNFTSISDLVDCLRASSYIPIYSSKEPLIYKGHHCYDGQLGLNKSLGCPDTDSRRTIRINPYQFTSSLISNQNLLNEFITPNLTKRDQFLMYYIRLKSLIYQLCLREIALENLKMANEFPKEVNYCINLYYNISPRSTSKINVIKNFNKDYKKSREYTNLLGLWNSEKLLDLFVLVVMYEKILQVDKYSAKRYRLDPVSDILTKFGKNTPLKKSIQASSITLLTYLYLKMSKYPLSTPIQQIPDTLYPIINKDVDDSPNKEKINILKNLLLFITPPFTLNYTYCNTNELLYNIFPGRKLFRISLHSADQYKLRFFYDLGKTESFRWLIQEYIKFENYVYLKILQLITYNSTDNPDSPVSSNEFKDDDSKEPLHEVQKKLINNTLSMVGNSPLESQIVTDSVHYKFFKKLNLSVRNCILSNCIDPHFSHIFTHSHFWNYNKHFKI